MAENLRVPLDIVHAVLGTFGITKPTPEYERWVRPDGMDFDDLVEVLGASPFYFVIDWRASSGEELEIIAAGLSRLGANLEIDLAPDDDEAEGFVSSGG